MTTTHFQGADSEFGVKYTETDRLNNENLDSRFWQPKKPPKLFLNSIFLKIQPEIRNQRPKLGWGS